MKLYIIAESERGKAVNKSGNSRIEIDLTIERKLIGRVVMRYEEGNECTIYFYPVDASIGKSGRVLLHTQKTKCPCNNCGSMQFPRNIKYLGDSVWECPDCRK
ncbi:hypothetical protein M0R04_10130 [Candidatus Dojkabacteria bacterium]|jgi:hypothetical protein|nr:hypothetical protein [Candidatus Dojkabacteria bacterium]